MNTENSNALLSWELLDSLWEILRPMIPKRKSHLGRPRNVNFKKILAGIFYVLRTGIQWQALPRENFGPPSTVYHYFKTWADCGIFEKMWAAANETYDELSQLDWQWQSVDGAMTKAPLGGEATLKSHRPRQEWHETVFANFRQWDSQIVSAGTNVVDFKLS